MFDVIFSALVGETFVTRKVTRSVAQIHLGHMESVSIDYCVFMRSRWSILILTLRLG